MKKEDFIELVEERLDKVGYSIITETLIEAQGYTEETFQTFAGSKNWLFVRGRTKKIYVMAWVQEGFREYRVNPVDAMAAYYKAKADQEGVDVGEDL